MLGFTLTIRGHNEVETTISVNVEEDQVPQGVCLMTLKTTGDKQHNIQPVEKTMEMQWSKMAEFVACRMVNVLSGFRTKAQYDAEPPYEGKSV